jgi:hypothetical protein
MTRVSFLADFEIAFIAMYFTKVGKNMEDKAARESIFWTDKASKRFSDENILNLSSVLKMGVLSWIDLRLDSPEMYCSRGTFSMGSLFECIIEGRGGKSHTC